jgi:hypothetical protein
VFGVIVFYGGARFGLSNWVWGGRRFTAKARRTEKAKVKRQKAKVKRRDASSFHNPRSPVALGRDGCRAAGQGLLILAAVPLLT